jgi:hypothetical protein
VSDVNIAVLRTGIMEPGIAVGMAHAGHTVARYGRSPASLERGFFESTDERARAVRAVRDQFLLARLKGRRATRSAPAANAQSGCTGGA